MDELPPTNTLSASIDCWRRSQCTRRWTALHANFDQLRLVPPEFRSPKFQPTLAVAPLSRSVCESIELNASRPQSLQDDRFKLLNHEHLKRSYTQLIKAASDPETLTEIANDPHPFWTSIVSNTAVTGYNFQPPPRWAQPDYPSSYLASCHIDRESLVRIIVREVFQVYRIERTPADTGAGKVQEE